MLLKKFFLAAAAVISGSISAAVINFDNVDYTPEEYVPDKIAFLDTIAVEYRHEFSANVVRDSWKKRAVSEYINRYSLTARHDQAQERILSLISPDFQNLDSIEGSQMTSSITSQSDALDPTMTDIAIEKKARVPVPAMIWAFGFSLIALAGFGSKQGRNKVNPTIPLSDAQIQH